ncbi:hypothetical protein SHI21_13625 [Bacteriovorax sp. PP10]|uniref:Uncharacterized protein n=1 Tax=Bacteriovorax antarcticus TaxID=3088717 RepID=A0ABU5VW31_9BACT|nr:hypothetical protein [Bacteriovorax sp. PP10]MEA9357259.1 hypothetical protein [Bacteriovorax sp. PP10]
MSNALKISPTTNISKLKQHMDQTDNLIHTSITRSVQIGNRNCVDRIFANNTKDIANTQEMLSIATKMQSQVITNCLLLSLENTRTTQDVVLSMEVLEEKLHSDLAEHNINIKEITEKLYSSLNKQQTSITQLKLYIENQVSEQEKLKDLINTRSVSEMDFIKENERSKKEFKIQLEKITNEMNIIQKKNNQLIKLATGFLFLWIIIATGFIFLIKHKL